MPWCQHCNTYIITAGGRWGSHAFPGRIVAGGSIAGWPLAVSEVLGPPAGGAGG